jgi:gamma-glutamylcyclotransferase (GGCT)/AIG2-like uncharacterized protein YtfP
VIPLFVFGALATGGERAALLGSRRRRSASVAGQLWVLPGGGPVLLAASGERVDGELVEGVDPRLLGLLDHLEGTPEGLVRRELVEVRVGLRAERAWTWLTDAARARTGRRWGGGRWRATTRR